MSKIEYYDLIFEISTGIDVNQLERLVFMCTKKISKDSEGTIKSIRGLFKELEKQGYLGIDRLENLKQILKQLKKRSMLRKVEEFEIKRKAQSVGISASFKQAAVNFKGAIKMVCNFRTIGGALLVVGSGMALCSCSTLDEYVETFNKVVLVAHTKLVEISEGSLCFTVQAETSASLKELWDIYKDGTLQRRLQEFLVTDDLKQLTNAEDIDMAIFIDEQEYVTSFNFLQNQAVPDMKEERFRRKSDSFFHINSNQREITMMKLIRAENQLSFERQVHGEEIKKIKEKIILAREPRAPNIKQEELPGRRTRRHSDSLLYCKPNEVEEASMKQTEQAEEWRKEKQILELKLAELKEALKTERRSNMNPPNVEQEGRPGRRTRRNSDSFLCVKPNENEIGLMKLMEETEDKWKEEKKILELKIVELDETLKAKWTRDLNQYEILERPRERRRRNSDSILYYKARKEEVEQTENQLERTSEDGAQLGFEKRMIVQNYLQNIHETQSMMTETTDSGIGTLGATSEIEMQDISGGDHKLYLKDLSQGVIRKVEERLRNDKTALKQICQSFGMDISWFYSRTRKFSGILSMFQYTPVKLLKEVFEALQLYDLISLLEKGKPRVTGSLLTAPRLQEIEKLRNPDDRPISYHSSIAVLIINNQQTCNTEGIEKFFKGLNTKSEVTMMCFGNDPKEANGTLGKMFGRKRDFREMKEKMEIFERELNKLRLNCSKVIQSWISNQDKFSLFAVFFVCKEVDSYSLPEWLSFNSVKERLVTSFPKKVKLIIHPNSWMPRTRPREELVDVSASFGSDDFLTSVLEIFTKRWQTMDLISMMRELQRSLGEKKMEEEMEEEMLRNRMIERDFGPDLPREIGTVIHAINENLSCRIRFTMHEEPTN